MKKLLIVLAFALGGCATTPSETRELDTRLTVSFPANHQTVARCIYDQVYEHRMPMVHNDFDLVDYGDHVEVTGTMGNVFQSYMFVVDVSPSGNGSVATLRGSSKTFTSVGRKAIEDCSQQ